MNAISCTASSIQQVYDHIKEKGISTYDSYPYDAQVKVCRSRRGTDSGVRITGYAEIPGNEESLKQAVGEYDSIFFIYHEQGTRKSKSMSEAGTK